jgi:hypothetical protein
MSGRHQRLSFSLGEQRPHEIHYLQLLGQHSFVCEFLRLSDIDLVIRPVELESRQFASTALTRDGTAETII